jgi:hypothetical protein
MMITRPAVTGAVVALAGHGLAAGVTLVAAAAGVARSGGRLAGGAGRERLLHVRRFQRLTPYRT